MSDVSFASELVTSIERRLARHGAEGIGSLLARAKAFERFFPEAVWAALHRIDQQWLRLLGGEAEELADPGGFAADCRLVLLAIDALPRTASITRPPHGASSAESCPEELPPGFVFDRYVIRECIGRGGTARVYRAEHESLGTEVALKVLDRWVLDRPLGKERFLREGRATATVRHPNVVRLLDCNIWGGRPFLAMELLRGTDLDTRIACEGPLPETAIVALALPVIDALRAVHAAGIVHRDLKPSNIFLAVGEHGEVSPKLLDFGISKLSAGLLEPGSHTTTTRDIIGTPTYMAPEAFGGVHNLGPKADQYSLGAVLYECAVGRPIHEGATLLGLLKAIAAGSIRPPRAVGADISRQLERAILRACCRNPQERFPTLEKLGRTLWLLADDDTKARYFSRFGTTPSAWSALDTEFRTGMGAIAPEVPRARRSPWARARVQLRRPGRRGWLALSAAALGVVALGRHASTPTLGPTEPVPTLPTEVKPTPSPQAAEPVARVQRGRVRDVDDADSNGGGEATEHGALTPVLTPGPRAAGSGVRPAPPSGLDYAALDALDWGLAELVVPERLEHDASTAVGLALTSAPSAQAWAALLPTIKNGAGVQIAPEMVARLVGPAFEIVGGPDLQAVMRTGRTDWSWQITPRPEARGRQPLSVTLAVRFRVDGHAIEHVIETYQRTIEIQVSGWQLFTQFLAQHWQWLFGALSPAAIWLWRRKRGGRKAPPQLTTLEPSDAAGTRAAPTLSFGEWLTVLHARSKKNLSTFAATLNIAPERLRQIEAGEYHCSPKQAAEFARILGENDTYFVQLALQDLVHEAGLSAIVEMRDPSADATEVEVSP